jgi:hypothetical protein
MDYCVFAVPAILPLWLGFKKDARKRKRRFTRRFLLLALSAQRPGRTRQTQVQTAKRQSPKLKAESPPDRAIPCLP